MRAPEPAPSGPDSPDLAAIRAGVDALGCAPPDLLGDRLLQRRFDRKYLASLAQVAQLIRALQGTHAVLLAGHRRLARYETTYFDTDQRKAFHDHRRGRPRRAKVRARTYLDRSLTVLEVKQRSGRGSTIKARRDRDSNTEDLSPVERDWAREHTGWRDAIEATGANSFQRITLLGTHHVERLTIDVGIEFRHARRSIPLMNTTIIELKTPTRGQVSPAADALTRLGLRPRGFSKYCVGSLLLDEDLPDNRFRLALRAMGRLEAK